MADDNVLREFLVSLGFRVDEEKHKLFQRSLKLSTEEVHKLGLAITSVSIALAAGFERIADQFQSLYYISQRTGTTIQNLKDLQYAAGQVGGSADAMTQALMHAQVLFQQPGGVGMVRAFTHFKGQIKDAKDELGVLLDYLAKLYASGGNGPFMARQIASTLGFNYDALLPDIINRRKERAAQAEYDARANAAGLTPKEMQDLGKSAVDFGNELSKLWSEFGLLGARAESDFIGPVTKGLTTITDEVVKLTNQFGHLDLGTRRWIEFGGAVTVVGGGLAATLATLKAIKGVLGIGGGAAAKQAIQSSAPPAEAGAAGGMGITGWLGAVLGQLGPEIILQHLLDKWQQHPETDPLRNLKNRFHMDPVAPGIGRDQSGKVIPLPQSYQPGTGEGAGGLFHRMAYREGGDRGGAYSVASDLQDWLHGSTSFVPMVRLLGFGDSSGGGAGYGNGTIPASYETGGAGGNAGSTEPLGPGGTPGKLSAAGTALANKLYLHARAPTDEGGLGLDRSHALAMLGNAFAESYLNPGAVGDNGQSFGLFQEHGDRMTAMLRELGPRARDPLAQLDFAFKEQMARDPAFFKRQGSVGDLTNDFERSFERPLHPTDRGAFSESISRALGGIGDTRLGTGVTHNHGDKNVTINQGDMHVTVHGNAGDAAGAMRTAHNRVLGDAVRNIAPVLA